MKFITFLPYLEIDWAATGSMIGAIGTMILTAYIAYKQYKLEKRQTDKEYKIILFEKRYEIYYLFFKYYSITKEALMFHDKKNSDANFYSQLRYFILNEPLNIQNKMLDIDNTNTNISKLYRTIKINQRKNVLNIEFLERNKYKLDMAEFCFDKDISTIIKEFSLLLFENIQENYEGDIEYYIEHKYKHEIKKIVKCIEDLSIISKMKSYLNLNISD